MWVHTWVRSLWLFTIQSKWKAKYNSKRFKLRVGIDLLLHKILILFLVSNNGVFFKPTPNGLLITFWLVTLNPWLNLLLQVTLNYSPFHPKHCGTFIGLSPILFMLEDWVMNRSSLKISTFSNAFSTMKILPWDIGCNRGYGW